MAIVFNSDAGTISGLSVGGLPDGIVDSDTLASGAGGVSGITSSADATAITIDSNENVGIGVTPKTWDSRKALQIGGNGTLAGSASVGAGGYLQLLQNAYTDGTWKYISTDEAARLRSQDGQWNFDVAASGSADSAISWTNALTITNDGLGLSQFTAKAWVRVNMETSHVINDSFNISSISDDGTGVCTVNIATDPANSNFAIAATGFGTSAGSESVSSIGTGTFTIKLQLVTSSSISYYDRGVMAVVFGD